MYKKHADRKKGVVFNNTRQKKKDTAVSVDMFSLRLLCLSWRVSKWLPGAHKADCSLRDAGVETPELRRRQKGREEIKKKLKLFQWRLRWDAPFSLFLHHVA